MILVVGSYLKGHLVYMQRSPLCYMQDLCSAWLQSKVADGNDKSLVLGVLFSLLVKKLTTAFQLQFAIMIHVFQTQQQWTMNTDHFTCTSANVIYCITCTLCKKLYIGETGRRLGDRFREHLRDVEKDEKDASKPIARHFNLPNHSMQRMAVCDVSLHQGNTASRKTLEQKFIFQIGTLNPNGINERFSFN